MIIDEEKLSQMKAYLKNPRTVEDLEAELTVSRRTVFRYLKVLEDRGARVKRANIGRPTKYQIGG